MTFCNTPKSMPCSVLIRGACSCSRWKQLETHSRIQRREGEALEYSALNRISPKHAASKCLEVADRLQDSEGMEDIKKSRPSKHNQVRAHMNSQSLWEHAHSLHGSALYGVQEQKGEADTCSYPEPRNYFQFIGTYK